jgi:aminoglycoside phosphotransferase (APT) family kinase protein
VDPDGRERLVYIAGDVPITPFPAWAQTDEVLASIARLLRRYHDAAIGFAAPPGTAWSGEMADGKPGPGAVVCHNDVCLENVVFRDGEAVALLDFDFAAPGRPVYDLACMVRMCAPVDTAADAARWGWEPVDVAQRLRLAADAYGLDAAGRSTLLDLLAGSIARGGEFLARRIAAGEQAFIDMVAAGGGMERFDRRRAWFAAEHDRIAAALA